MAIIANDDIYAVQEDIGFIRNVLTNDILVANVTRIQFGATGPVMAVVAGADTVINGAFGRLTIRSDGSFDYTVFDILKQGQTGTDNFVYGGNAVGGLLGTVLTAQANLIFNVTGVNDAPVAVADNAAAVEDGPVIMGSVATNDSDADADAVLTYTLDAPVDGLTFNADGSYSFDPGNAAYQSLQKDAVLNVVANYTVTDEFGASAASTLTIAVTGTNDLPVLQNPADPPPVIENLGTVNGNNPTNIPLISGNFVVQDVDIGDILSASRVGFTILADGNAIPTSVLTNAERDTLINGFSLGGPIVSDGSLQNISYQYDPAGVNLEFLREGQVLAITFDVQVSDGQGGLSTQDISFRVTGTNDRPTLASAATPLAPAAIDEALDARAQDIGPITGNFNVNDRDVGDTLRVISGEGVARIGGNVVNANLLGINALIAADALSLSGPQTSNGGGRSFNYSYDPAAADLDFLSANEVLTITYTLVAQDNLSNSTNTRNLVITINGKNDAPLAMDDAVMTLEDTALVIDVATLLANDDDPDNDALTITAVANAVGGMAVLNGAGTQITFTPNANFNGAASFEYTVSDFSGATDVGRVSVDVTPVNDAPVANPDTATATEDGPVVLGSVAGNDNDVDAGDMLRYTLDAPVAGLTLNLDGSYSFDPSDAAYQSLRKDAPFNVVASYTVSDGALSDGSTLTITVTGVNDDPVLQDTVDPAAVVENNGNNGGANVNIPLTTGSFMVRDVDVGDTLTPSFMAKSILLDGGPVPISSLTNAQRGTLLSGFSLSGPLVATGADQTITYNYDPAGLNLNFLRQGEVLSINFDVTVSDGQGGSATQDVSFRVNGTNDRPAMATPGTPLTPAAIMEAADASAQDIGPITGNFNISDLDVGDNLLATAGAALLRLNGTLLSDAQVTALGLDALAGPLGLSGGQITNGGNRTFTYTYDPAAADLDFLKATDVVTITYILGAVDDFSTSVNTRNLVITINGSNDAPSADNERYTVAEDGTLTINAANGVLVGDTDPDAGAVLSAALVSSTTNGKLSLAADGSFVYTPNLNFNGIDSFTYKANDGIADSNTATVTIMVNAVNDAPVANNDTATTDEEMSVLVNVLANDTDVDNPGNSNAGLSIKAGSLGFNPALGMAVIEAGQIRYTPAAGFNGNATITYLATDGMADSNLATLTVTVNAVNDAPVAVNDTAIARENGGINNTRAGVNPGGNVIGNDIDLDGPNPLMVTAIRTGFEAFGGTPGTVGMMLAGSFGTLTLNADGSYLYIVDNANPTINALRADQSQFDVFTYTISDGMFTDRAELTITINGDNDGPMTLDLNRIATEDTLLISNVFDGGVDPEGQELLYVALTGTKNGVLSLGSDGSFTYQPNPNFFGVDSFTYRAQEPGGILGEGLQGNTATVTITVDPVADDTLLVAGPTYLDSSITFTVSDADGRPLNISPNPLGLAPVAVPNNALATANVSARGAVVQSAITVGDGFGANAVFGWAGLGTVNADTFTLTNPGAAYGFGGDDTLTGSAGTDFLFGSDGNDIFNFTAGDDFYNGGADTTVTGDVLQFNAATIFNDSSDARLVGVETVRLNAASLVSFANQTEALDFEGSAGADSITNGSGGGRLSGNGGGDTLIGGAGADQIIGGAGNDTLQGNGGGDTLIGGAGADQIIGGAGNDTLQGNGGADTFLFDTTAAGNGTDSIIGFVTGLAGDILNFTAFRGALTALDNTTGNGSTGLNFDAFIANPGNTNANDRIVKLVDIAGGQDIMTAAGLRTALANGGEYQNINYASAGAGGVILTATSNAATTFNAYYVTGASNNATGPTVSLVGVVNIGTGSFGGLVDENVT